MRKSKVQKTLDTTMIGGVRQKLHVFFMDLPLLDAPFIKAYPAETTEALLDGHASAFAFFGLMSKTCMRTRAAVDPLRQYQAGGGAHSRRWHARSNTSIHGRESVLSIFQ
jgi:transposase